VSIKFFSKPVLTLSILSLLSGCSNVAVQKEYQEDAIVQDLQKGADRVIKQQQEVVAKISSVNDKETSNNTPFISAEPYYYKSKLPEDIASLKVTYNSPFSKNIFDVLSTVEDWTGMKAVIEQDVLSVDTTASQASQNPGAADSASLGGDSLGGAISATQSVVQEDKVSINYISGRLDGFLDALSLKLQANWRYDEASNSVIFYKYITSIFKIAAAPGGSENSSSFSTASATTSYKQNVTLWGSLSDGLTKLLSPKGRFSLMESSSIVTVRDTPDVINEIEKYINALNQDLSLSVDFNIQVYSVLRDRTDNRQVNWDAIIANSDILTSLSTASSAPTNTSSFVFEVPDTVNADFQRYVGSKAFVDMLSKYGESFKSQSYTLQAINNQPTPYKVTSTFPYVKQQTPTITDTGVVISLETDEKEYGAVFQILPSIQPNREDVRVQFSVQISNLNSIESFSSGQGELTTFAQRPNMSEREYMSHFWAKNGSSIVITGLDVDTLEKGSSGIASPEAWALGGAKDFSRKKETIIMILTPKVNRINSSSSQLYRTPG